MSTYTFDVWLVAHKERIGGGDLNEAFKSKVTAVASGLQPAPARIRFSHIVEMTFEIEAKNQFEAHKIVADIRAQILKTELGPTFDRTRDPEEKNA